MLSSFQVDDVLKEYFSPVELEEMSVYEKNPLVEQLKRWKNALLEGMKIKKLGQISSYLLDKLQFISKFQNQHSLIF